MHANTVRYRLSGSFFTINEKKRMLIIKEYSSFAICKIFFFIGTSIKFCVLQILKTKESVCDFIKSSYNKKQKNAPVKRKF